MTDDPLREELESLLAWLDLTVRQWQNISRGTQDKILAKYRELTGFNHAADAPIVPEQD